MRDAEAKMTLAVSYDFTEDEKVETIIRVIFNGGYWDNKDCFVVFDNMKINCQII